MSFWDLNDWTVPGIWESGIGTSGTVALVIPRLARKLPDLIVQFEGSVPRSGGLLVHFGTWDLILYLGFGAWDLEFAASTTFTHSRIIPVHLGNPALTMV